MILHAEGTVFRALHSLDGIVKEIDMRDGQGRVAYAVRIDRVGVILRGDLYLAGQQILDRVIAAAVTEFQLVGFRAVGERQDLMSQTNAEDRDASDQLSYRVDDLGDVLGPFGFRERISSAVV